MKKILFCLFVTVNAFAVETQECPSSISFNESEFSVWKTADQVFYTLGGKENLEPEEIQAVTTALENTKNSKKISRSFDLFSASSGRCIYKEKESVERIQIYTEKKQDMMMIQTEIGPRGILLRTYAKIASMTPAKIVLLEEKQSIALAVPRYPYESYSAGGGLANVGKAKLTLKAKE
jgi:hypothetical protein